MRTTIGDHFHPRGDINNAVFGLIERLYGRLQKLNPWLDKANALTDVAVISPKNIFSKNHLHDKYPPSNLQALYGVTRILCELKVQFDILTDILPWKGYKVLILPDFVELDEIAIKKLKEHLVAGGMIVSSGWSGLDVNKNDFVLKNWGLKFKGDSPYNPAYLRVKSLLNEKIPDMPICLYESGSEIEALKNTEVLAEIVKPFFNRHWDGEHGFLYVPPDKSTGSPAVTKNKNVTHISHPIFYIYYKHAPVPMKQIVSNILKIILPEPIVKTGGLPSFARVTVTCQENRRMVYVLSYVPERRGEKIDMIEEPIELRNVKIGLRLDKRLPKKVYLAPDREALNFKIESNYIRITVPVINGYAVVVFEE
jgi:hypothetical protein